MGLRNGTKLRHGYSFSVNQFSQIGFFSQWHLVVCYHHSVTDPNLKPIFCRDPELHLISWSNAFINDENQLETKRPLVDSHHLKIGLMLKTKSVIGGIYHFDWVKGIYCFALWNGSKHSWKCYTFCFIAIPFLATVLLYCFTHATEASMLCLMQIFAVSERSLIDRQVSCIKHRVMMADWDHDW